MAVQVADLVARLSLDLSAFTKNISAGESQLRKLGQRMSEAGQAISLGVSLPLAAAAGASVKLSTSFETAMTKVITLSGVAESQMGAWQAEILKLAPAVGKTPQDLAEGLLVVTSTGLKGAEALEILASSARASATGLGEVKDIARVITAAMTAYGKENLTAARAADILFAAVREGGAEASEFAGSLGRVVGIAAQVGTSFEEVSGFIATFTRLGVNADEAVTALRGVMTTLLKPSKDAEDQLATLGLTIDQLRQSVKEKGLTAAMIDLVKSLKGNEDAIAAIVPNVRALAGVLGVAGSQADAAREVIAKLANSAGDLDQGFERTTKTLGFQFNQLKASMAVLAIEIGDKLAPSMAQLVRNAQPLLDLAQGLVAGFASLPGPVQAFAVGVLTVGVALGPVLFALGNLVKVVGFVATAVVAAGTTIAAMPLAPWIVALAAAGVAIGILVSELRELNRVPPPALDPKPLVGKAGEAQDKVKDLKAEIASLEGQALAAPDASQFTATLDTIRPRVAALQGAIKGLEAQIPLLGAKPIGDQATKSMDALRDSVGATKIEASAARLAFEQAFGPEGFRGVQLGREAVLSLTEALSGTRKGIDPVDRLLASLSALGTKAAPEVREGIGQVIAVIGAAREQMKAGEITAEQFAAGLRRQAEALGDVGRSVGDVSKMFAPSSSIDELVEGLGDVSGAARQVGTDLTASLGALEAQSRAMAGSGTAAAGLQEAMDLLTKAAEDMGAKGALGVGQLTAKFAQLSAEVARNPALAEQASEEIISLALALERGGASADKINAALHRLSPSLALLKRARDAQEDLALLAKQFQLGEVSLGTYTEAIRRQIAELERVPSPTRAIRSAILDLRIQLQNLTKDTDDYAARTAKMAEAQAEATKSVVTALGQLHTASSQLGAAVASLGPSQGLAALIGQLTAAAENVKIMTEAARLPTQRAATETRISERARASGRAPSAAQQIAEAQAVAEATAAAAGVVAAQAQMVQAYAQTKAALLELAGPMAVSILQHRELESFARVAAATQQQMAEEVGVASGAVLGAQNALDAYGESLKGSIGEAVRMQDSLRSLAQRFPELGTAARAGIQTVEVAIFALSRGLARDLPDAIGIAKNAISQLQSNLSGVIDKMEALIGKTPALQELRFVQAQREAAEFSVQMAALIQQFPEAAEAAETAMDRTAQALALVRRGEAASLQEAIEQLAGTWRRAGAAATDAGHQMDEASRRAASGRVAAGFGAGPAPAAGGGPPKPFEGGGPPGFRTQSPTVQGQTAEGAFQDMLDALRSGSQTIEGAAREFGQQAASIFGSFGTVQAVTEGVARAVREFKDEIGHTGLAFQSLQDAIAQQGDARLQQLDARLQLDAIQLRRRELELQRAGVSQDQIDLQLAGERAAIEQRRLDAELESLRLQEGQARALAASTDAVVRFTAALAARPGPGHEGAQAGGGGGLAAARPGGTALGRELEGFATGGIVPGPTGAPKTVVAHGGEIITPPDTAYGLVVAGRERGRVRLQGGPGDVVTAQLDDLSTRPAIAGAGADPTAASRAPLATTGAVGAPLAGAVSSVAPALASQPDVAAAGTPARAQPSSVGAGGGRASVRGLEGFATGGVVPGPTGAPRVVVAHGGEEITPPGFPKPFLYSGRDPTGAIVFRVGRDLGAGPPPGVHAIPPESVPPDVLKASGIDPRIFGPVGSRPATPVATPPALDDRRLKDLEAVVKLDEIRLRLRELELKRLGLTAQEIDEQLEHARAALDQRKLDAETESLRIQEREASQALRPGPERPPLPERAPGGSRPVFPFAAPFAPGGGPAPSGAPRVPERTPKFAGGGIVPGPAGAPRVVIAEGGEEISTPEQSERRAVEVGRAAAAVAAMEQEKDPNRIRGRRAAAGPTVILSGTTILDSDRRVAQLAAKVDRAITTRKRRGVSN